MQGTTRTVGLILAVAWLTACSANHYSIFRQTSLSDAESSITILDAKARVVLAGKVSTTGERQRFCAEPSPDVFAVVAQALSAGGTFGRSANSATIQAALNAAFSSSEQGSTIPRTQTINMLRELMFRTCERYLDGGISDLELPLQAIRDQRLMVSILAIEQLTGTITAKPVVIGAQGQASGGASGAEAAVRLDDAYKDLQAKNAAQQNRQNEYNELTTDKKDCETIADAVAKKNEDSLSDELKGKKAKCESATSELAQAKNEQADSADHYAKINQVAAAGGVPVSTGTTVMDPKASGGLDRADVSGVADVSSAVREIVALNFQQDEFLLLCLKVLNPNSGINTQLVSAALDPKSGVQQTCIDYVKSRINLEQKRNLELASALEVSVAQVATDQVRDTLFESFWSKVSDQSGHADTVKVGSLKLRIKDWPTCFKDGGSKAEYYQCFIHLRAQKKRDLAT